LPAEQAFMAPHVVVQSPQWSGSFIGLTHLVMASHSNGAYAGHEHMAICMTSLPGHLLAPPLPPVPVPALAPPVPVPVPAAGEPAVDDVPPVPAVPGPGVVFAGSFVPLQATTEAETNRPVAAATRRTTCLNVIFTCNILCFGQ